MMTKQEFGSRMTILAERLGSLEEDRVKLLETVRKLVCLCQEVRRGGILWLEEASEQESDTFLRSCLRYITSGKADPEDFREYASIWLLMAQENGMRLLEMAVIADALEQILRERTPEQLWRRMGAWLGTDLAEQVEAELAAMEQDCLERQWVQRMDRQTSFELRFDALLDLPSEVFSRLLRGTDLQTLTLALMGAGSGLLGRVAEAVPDLWADVRKASGLLQAPRQCDVQAAQVQILEALSNMA